MHYLIYFLFKASLIALNVHILWHIDCGWTWIPVKSWSWVIIRSTTIIVFAVVLYRVMVVMMVAVVVVVTTSIVVHVVPVIYLIRIPWSGVVAMVIVIIMIVVVVMLSIPSAMGRRLLIVIVHQGVTTGICRQAVGDIVRRVPELLSGQVSGVVGCVRCRGVSVIKSVVVVSLRIVSVVCSILYLEGVFCWIIVCYWFLFSLCE